MTNQVVLIGLDGATFKMLDMLMEQGVMPFLKSFVASGARADLRSVIPPLTPPAWTSLMTGRSPGNHSVFDFFRPVSPESKHIQFTTSNDIHCETIWSIASRQDLRATALNFPLMFPPPPINGHVVPGGWMPWRQLRLGCYPRDLYDRLKALPGFNARELAMDPSLEEKALEGCQQDEYADWIELHTRREQHWFEILRYLMKNERSELTAILFDGVDKVQHLCWRFLDLASLGDSPEPWELQIRELCLNYFRQLDHILEEIVALSGPDANVVFTSDHGFGPTVEIFHVNTWLAEHGYLTWSDTAESQAAESEQLGIGKIARHAYQLDWEKTTAYASTPSSNGIHIVVANGPDSPGVSPEDYPRFREQLIASLKSFTDGESDVPIVSQIWTREEAFPGPYQHLAPDLTLELRDGGHVSILAADSPLKPRSEIKGTHRPEGIFIAGGRGIRQGVSLPELSILDVPSMLLYCLGLPIPEEFEGRMPTEVFDEARLREQPVRIGESTTQADVNGFDPDEEIVMSPEDEERMVERLRALGYID